MIEFMRKRGETKLNEEEERKEETEKCVKEEILLTEERGLLGVAWGEKTFFSSLESV